MSADALVYAGIAELGRLFRRKEVSPVELVKTLLARVERLDGRLHCFVTLTAERALAEAQAAEAKLHRGEAASPLLGIPVGYKDIYATRGVLTTAGSAVLADWMPIANSWVMSLPIITAPACWRRVTHVASASGTQSASTAEPAVVSTPRVA